MADDPVTTTLGTPTVEAPIENAGEVDAGRAAAAPVPPTARPASQTAAQEWAYEKDWRGQRYSLKRDEVEFLIDSALTAYEQASERQKASEGETRAAETQPQDDLRARLDQLEGSMRQDSLMRELDSSAGEVAFYADFAGEDEALRAFKTWSLILKSLNPSLSVRQAMEQTAKTWGTVMAKANEKFVEGKIRAASTSAPGPGGGSPGPQRKEFNRQDLFNGNVEKAALEMARSMARQARG